MMGRRTTGAAALVVVSLIAACGPPPTIEGSGPAVVASALPECPVGALAAATGKVQVVLWHGLGATSQKALDDMVAKYNASQDKVEVVARQQGTSYDEVLRKYEAAAASGGLPGIIYVEDTTTQTMIDGGTIFPSQACMEATDFDLNRYQPAVRSYYTSEDVFWPAYANVSGPVLYFNEAHFKKAGLDPTKPPKTLAEMRTAAQALKKAGIEKPIALKLDEWYLECWLNGAGEQVVNNNNGHDGRPTKSNINNAAALEVLTLLKQMKKEGLLQAFSDTDGQVNQFLALASQQSSMTIETSTGAAAIKSFLGGDLEEAAGMGEVDTRELIPRAASFPGLTEPGKVRVSGGAFFMVQGTKKDPVAPVQIAASWDFFQFISKPENVVEQHITGSYLPVISPAEDDPKLVPFWDEDLAGRMLKVARAQLADIDPKNPGPLMGPYPEYVTSVKNLLDRAVLLDEDPKTVLAEAQAEVDKELQADAG